MVIVIPTMGRINKQDTWSALGATLRDDVWLLSPESEAMKHANLGRRVIPVPMEIQGIAATRQWLMEKRVDTHVVMMDDDLTFSVRREDDPEKFRHAGERDIQEMLDALEALFTKYKHVSISMREGANRDTSAVRTCCRVARVIGYEVDTFLRTGADFRNSTVMDDFEVTLYLLTRGYANGVLNSYVQNQRGSGTEGGAAIYRTMEMHAQAAHKLASRYPRYVKPVQKTTKTAWGGQTRTDVVVQWKRAYEERINA